MKKKQSASKSITRDSNGKFAPKAGKQLTFDGFDNFISRLGLNNNNALSGGTYIFSQLTKNRLKLEAAYRGSWSVGVIVDAVADDMTRAGIDVTTNEADEDLKDLFVAISRLKIWQSLNQTIKWSRLYGGCCGLIQIAGQDPSTPLDVDTVGEKQFLGIVPFDRWQLNPDLTRLIKSGPDMGLPEYYQIVSTNAEGEPQAPTPGIGAITVHHSRMIRMVGIQLPYYQAINEWMWGESVLERLFDRLVAFDNATMSSASLIDRANLRTVKIKNLREIIASGNEAKAGLTGMFEMMRLLQVNEGLTLLDADDEFASTAYSFAGLSDMMLQFGQQLAGASGIPLTRMFGQSPAGLSATGESDMRMYYDNINAQQESKMRGPWDLLLKVLWRSTFGKPAPKDLEFTFTPLWQMSAIDKATIAKSNTETIIGAFDAGLNDKETSMKELREQSGDTGLFSNITDEAIKEAGEEEPPLPDAPEPDKPDGEGNPDQKDLAKSNDRSWRFPWNRKKK